MFANSEQFMASYDPLQKLSEMNKIAMSNMIKSAIKGHEAQRSRMIKLHERYKASVAGTPILTRTIEQPNKVNNKVNTPFFSTIIDTKVGYFSGRPITYDLNELSYESNQARYTLHDKAIQSFNRRNSIQKLDAETTKMASICGYAIRLLYIDLQGRERVMVIPPWEVIVLDNEDTGETACAIRYYEVDVQDGNKTRKAIRAEVYDQTEISYYLQDKEGNFYMDIQEEVNPRPHMFQNVPVIKFKNNEEELADGERVLNLIDAYDRSISDLNSEIEQLRLAYMIFKGVEPDEETMKRAKQTGGFGVDSDQDIVFLTKNLDSQAIEVHLDRLADNIMRFSDTVNLTDKSFGGNLSGIAIKYKLFGLESKCGIMEMNFQESLYRQYEVLCTALSTKGIEINPEDVFFTFSRNAPVNVAEEIENNVKLKGLVSEKTRLGRLSFVSDVEKEMAQMEMERRQGLITNNNPTDPAQKGTE